jgi:hypothetical protein
MGKIRKTTVQEEVDYPVYLRSVNDVQILIFNISMIFIGLETRPFDRGSLFDGL